MGGLFKGQKPASPEQNSGNSACLILRARMDTVSTSSETNPTEPTPALVTSSSVPAGGSVLSNTLPASSRLSPEEIAQIAAAVAGIIHPVVTTAPSNPLMSGSQAGVLTGSSASATSNTSAASTGNSG